MRTNRGLAVYLEGKRNRRHQRAIRQKRLKAGMPTHVPTKALSLSPEQKQQFSTTQTKSYRKSEGHILTPKSFAWLISICLHLILGAIIALLLIEVKDVDDDAITVEFFRAQIARSKRLMRTPARKSMVRQPAQIQRTRIKHQVTTAAQIPTGNAQFTLPVSDLSSTRPDDSDQGPQEKELGKKLSIDGGQTKVASLTQNIAPERSVRMSIVDEIGSTDLPELELAEISPIVSLTETTQPPRLRKKVEPKYPELARRAKKEGIVLLEATIGTDGIARDIRVIEELGFGCDQAAIEALKASRFVPAKRDSEVVLVQIRIPYRFKLE